MGLFYSVPFSAVAVTAANDLFEITVPAQASGGKPILVREIQVAQSSDYGDAAAEGASILVKRGSSNTAGSGGSAVTPVKHDTTQAAASFTAKTNNTTGASAGSGSLTTLRGDAFNIQFGWTYKPLPCEALQFNCGENCIVSLAGAPTDSLTISGTMVLEELQ